MAAPAGTEVKHKRVGQRWAWKSRLSFHWMLEVRRPQRPWSRGVAQAEPQSKTLSGTSMGPWRERDQSHSTGNEEKAHPNHGPRRVDTRIWGLIGRGRTGEKKASKMTLKF